MHELTENAQTIFFRSGHVRKLKVDGSMIVQKNEANELPIPTVWRAALKQVAASFVQGDQPEDIPPLTVLPIACDVRKVCLENIADYPDELGPLAGSAWDTSVYIWKEDYWEVLVDLSTASGDTSDLVMHARVHENNGKFIVELILIYVP